MDALMQLAIYHFEQDLIDASALVNRHDRVMAMRLQIESRRCKSAWLGAPCMLLIHACPIRFISAQG